MAEEPGGVEIPKPERGQGGGKAVEVIALFARHSSKHFRCINSFTPPNKTSSRNTYPHFAYEDTPKVTSKN